MRSMVNSAIVPSTSDIGAGTMSSTASPTRETRAGGRCSSPLSWSREPTNAYFHSSVRPDTDAEMRSGSGRRGGSSVTCAAPGEELAVGERRRRSRSASRPSARPVRRDRVGGAEQEHVDAVGEHDERDHLAGLGGLERVGEQQRRRARCRCCRRSSRGRRPALPSTRRAGRRCRAPRGRACR